MSRGEMGNDGGGTDLNLGTPPPASPPGSLSENPRPAWRNLVLHSSSSSPGPLRRSVKEVGNWEEKAKAAARVLAEVSKLPPEEPMRERRKKQGMCPTMEPS